METNITFLHKIWEQHDPDSLAFLDDREYTFREFDSYVKRFSTWVAAQGIKPGDRVGIFLPNCIEYIFTYFAINRIGAIGVPINSYLTDGEVEYIVKDSGMPLLISSRMMDVSAKVVLVGDVREAAEAISEEEIVPSYEKDIHDIATIIYTSGTTGSPKGAMLSHYNIVSNAFGLLSNIEIDSSARILAVLPLYHCFGFLGVIVLPLCIGASSFIQKTFQPSDTIRFIAENKLNVLFMVPPMYQLLARIKAVHHLNSVKYAISGGAAMPKAVALAFEEAYGLPILEGYGLSEASPVVSLNRVEKHKYYSIGLAIKDVTVRIQLDDGTEGKAGEIGELLVKGPNVMKGYWNLPEESAKALKDGWLHTGDMAYRDEDNYLYIVDRVKDMINLNGENVYPREVENCLYLHPDILEAAVVGKNDGLRGEVVWAYVVLKEGCMLNTRDMKAFLKEHLASFKIPRGFTQMESLPKNSTGKIMKRML